MASISAFDRGVSVGAVMAKQQGEPVAAAPRGGPVGKLAGILLIAAGLLGAYPGLARHVAVAQYGPAYEAIVLDAQTGQVLRELNPDVVTYPASLTKMMTLYLTFEALNQGRLRLHQVLRGSGGGGGRRRGDRGHGRQRVGLRPADDREGAPARHDADGLLQCLRLARPQPAHHRPRHRPAGARALSPVPARIPLFLDPGVRVPRRDHAQPQPSDGVVSRPRRHQ